MNGEEQQRMVKRTNGRRRNVDRIFAIKKMKNQKKWTNEEDQVLISLAERYREKHWKEISRIFPKKSSLQCFSRYKRIRPGIVKGSWTKSEDIMILELVEKYGKAWSKISKAMKTRNGKQIRDRFINVLDTGVIKGKFSEEEDELLVSLYKQHGPKWANISKFFPNRTADMIKNRFHSSIKKKLGGDFMTNFSKEFSSTFDQNEPNDFYNLNYYSSKQETADDLSRSVVGASSISNHYTISQASNESYIGSPCGSNQQEENSTKNFFNNCDNSNVNHLELAQNLKMNTNQINLDILNNGGELIKEEPLTGNGVFIWEFEDFFMA